MLLTDILNEQRVTTRLVASTKDDALLALAELFAGDDPNLQAAAVHDVLHVGSLSKSSLYGAVTACAASLQANPIITVTTARSARVTVDPKYPECPAGQLKLPIEILQTADAPKPPNV